jgi:hypothetical protein
MSSAFASEKSQGSLEKWNSRAGQEAYKMRCNTCVRRKKVLKKERKGGREEGKRERKEGNGKEKKRREVKGRKGKGKLGSVVHTCNPSPQEAEAGGSQAQNQPELRRGTQFNEDVSGVSQRAPDGKLKPIEPRKKGY